MRKIYLYFIAAIATIGAIESVSAQDYDRNVTVETEFQPIIQDAGKVNIKPHVQSTTIQPITVTYSEFSNEVNPTFTPSALHTQAIHFTQPDALNGRLRAGVGHINSEVLFEYTLVDKKKNRLHINADHRGGWGTKTLVDTKLGVDFSHDFKNGDMFYLNAFGLNQFYTRYGCYFLPEHNDLGVNRMSQMEDITKQNIWQGGIRLGYRSNLKQDLTYNVSLAYDALNMPTIATEHHAKADLHIQWKRDEHSVGSKVNFQGNFYQMNPEYSELLHNNRYNIRVEPFYEYTIDRFLLHVGMNIDLNYGKGTQFSKVDKLAFAPSPNVRFEAQLAPKWAILYGQATGRFARGNSEEFIAGNRYRDLTRSLTSLHTSGYTPIDAELGFRFRPEKNLFLEIHGGYSMQKNKTASIFVPYSPSLDYVYLNYNSGKIGAAISYHYQDIVTIHAWGDYLLTQNPEVENKSSLHKLNLSSITQRAYDCPTWKVGLDIDARIDCHWTLYSHNRFHGGAWALVAPIDILYGHITRMSEKYEKQLAPYIDLNIGCQYEFNNRLALYLDLMNLINRKNEIYYGYQTVGINFLVGVNWRF